MRAQLLLLCATFLTVSCAATTQGGPRAGDGGADAARTDASSIDAAFVDAARTDAGIARDLGDGPADMGSLPGTPGVTVDPTTGLSTTEAGGTDTFTVVLNAAPSASVTISLASSDSSEGTVSPASLVFTVSNWSTAQTVTLTGVDDSTADDDVAYTINTGATSSSDANYNGIVVADVAATNADNDVGPALPPRLMTKNIYGNPSASFTITFSGPASTNLQLRFRNRASELVHTSTVSALGSITLPAVAGVYTTELRDTTNGNISYGQATITSSIAGFTSIQTHSPATNFGPYAYWPSTSMEAGDYNNDGFQDMVFLSGTDASASIASPGLYLYKWNTTTSTLVFDAMLSIGTTTGGGVRFADFDNDADLDLVYAVNDPVAFEVRLCRMLNDGSGTFYLTTCVADAGTASARPYVYDIQVADLDRDGFVDVVSSGGIVNGSSWISARVSVWHNGGGSELSLGSELIGGGGGVYPSVAVGDLQDDGLLDIFAAGIGAGASGLTFFPQATDGSFAAATSQMFSTSGATQVSLGYLNGDTKLDAIILQGGTSNGSVLYSNTSDDTLAAMPITATGEQLSGRALIVDLAQSGSPSIVFPPKNRLLYADRAGNVIRTAANLTSSITVGVANTITGATTMSNWAEANSLFTDFDNDGRIDCFYFSVYGTKFFEVLRAH
ncbi:MAG: VCBS repeat-containing protein [Sandaracinaceae bacterium]|nr:VCBS repeat-containing protein [Sandaracinaceae bacterium]